MAIHMYSGSRYKRFTFIIVAHPAMAQRGRQAVLVLLGAAAHELSSTGTAWKPFSILKQYRYCLVSVFDSEAVQVLLGVPARLGHC